LPLLRFRGDFYPALEAARAGILELSNSFVTLNQLIHSGARKCSYVLPLVTHERLSAILCDVNARIYGIVGLTARIESALRCRHGGGRSSACGC
jgi:hypothetical protein